MSESTGRTDRAAHVILAIRKIQPHSRHNRCGQHDAHKWNNRLTADRLAVKIGMIVLIN